MKHVFLFKTKKKSKALHFPFPSGQRVTRNKLCIAWRDELTRFRWCKLHTQVDSHSQWWWCSTICICSRMDGPEKKGTIKCRDVPTFVCAFITWRCRDGGMALVVAWVLCGSWNEWCIHLSSTASSPLRTNHWASKVSGFKREGCNASNDDHATRTELE